MYRYAEQDLERWLVESRRKPLIIRGARQVGKSTLVRNFALNNKLTLYEINLERYPQLDKIFSSYDVKLILREISSILKTEIVFENSLLFIDEIQVAPHAIQALRYFYEDFPELAVVSAGSLLEFTLADQNFSMPVGRVEYLHLFPMSFEEFLLAKEEHFLVKFLRNYKLAEDIADSTHLQLLNLIREYMIVGGMPEAVLAFSQTKQLDQVYRVQDSIIATYQDDFGKYTKNKDILTIHTIFNFAPKSVGEKIKYVNISRDNSAKDLKNSIDLLNKARIITKTFHSTCSGIPIGADLDPNIYKLIFLDIGLMNRIGGLSWSDISPLDDIRLINDGSVAEQYVGQHLLISSQSYNSPALYYWLREGKADNAEIDFVISIGQQIIPVEVKAGKSGTLKSLLQFVYLKQIKLGLRFDLNKPSLQNIEHSIQRNNELVSVNYRLLSLPLYLSEQFNRLYDTLI